MTAAVAPCETTVRPLGIIELCLSNGRGGLEHYAAGLVPALRERGHRTLVVAQAGSEFAARVGQPPALALRPSRYLPWRGVRSLARLARDADIIHIHRSADLPLAALAKRFAGNRPALVYTRHMAITRNRRASHMHRWLHGQVDLLLVVTERLAAEARQRLPLPHARIRVLPLGVGPAPPPADCHSVRPPGRAFVVGCFSRIEPAKGQHELVAALAKLIEHGVDAAAVIAGPVMDAAYAQKLEASCKALSVADRVHFSGVLADARPSMACCDAVVMPSAAETFGLVLVEAMQMGIPVVASAAGGATEIVSDGETGLTYPVGDVDALAERLRRLATDPEYARALARAGHGVANERFDRRRHLEGLEALFYEAAKDRNVLLA
ncbi:MAG: glycosyltransferase family 4 protein [Gammaproteobacteria bacterium]